MDILTKVVCSADDYFMRDGKYEFQADELPEAHSRCRQKAETAMKNDAHLVIIDNTNTRRWEMEHYYELAEKYGYYVTEVTIGRVHPDVAERYHLRNNHGVPLETIQKMAERWEM